LHSAKFSFLDLFKLEKWNANAHNVNCKPPTNMVGWGTFMVKDSRIFLFELFMDKKPQQNNQTSWLDPIGLDQLLLEVISSKRMKVERKLLK